MSETKRYMDLHLRWDLDGMEKLGEVAYTQYALFIRNVILEEALSTGFTVKPSEFEMNLTNEGFREHPFQIAYAKQGFGEITLNEINGHLDMSEEYRAEMLTQGLGFLLSEMAKNMRNFMEDDDDV
ncbi:MAG: hypothetical protein GWO10_16335 [candidate division Zixibacteria bacterium]|nr:hypothetical protein [Gammaproteobacteria bacterium]NIR25701.1 hypothetical protein [Gammaproteobacteria bacterium]NIR65294.1 hypothetical protein [candidate division Zixibacteria bacterium]NIS52338.1 hypothetical protein [Phycisphaerae bacterium]NIX02137.1 hypothetical protein [Phycisphaerae bacterium]